MSKIYLLSHRADRFYSDFAGLSRSAEFCEGCEGRIDKTKPPLDYHWDDEFQTAKGLKKKGADFFWGSFFLMTTVDGKKRLDAISDAFQFHDTRPVRTKLVGEKLVVDHLPQPKEPLCWALPVHQVVAGVAGDPNEVCKECGMFVTNPRQLTRLLVNHNHIPACGVFSVAQNREPQVFVTEKTRDAMINAGVEAGFYPAGETL